MDLKDIFNKILRIIIACILFMIASMCFSYVVINRDTIQWYWLGLYVSGIIIGLVSGICITVSTFLY